MSLLDRPTPVRPRRSHRQAQMQDWLTTPFCLIHPKIPFPTLVSSQADFSVASWDNKVRIYEVTPQGQSEGRAMFEHQGPVLSTRWSPDGTKVISAGCDNAARLYDLQTQTPSQVAQHDQPIQSVRFVDILMPTPPWLLPLPGTKR